MKNKDKEAINEINEDQKKTIDLKFDFKGIIEDAEYVEAVSNDPKKAGLFKIMPANDWLDEAKDKPIPKMLFSELWYESELCILFADTNVGKSIIAVMIADSISRGVPVPGYKLEAAQQPVVLFDFELSVKQFENRYSNDYDKHYRFNKDFYRCEIDVDDDLPEQFETIEDYINFSIDVAVVKSKAKILIIDNITYLKAETERSRDALPLMKHLKQLKKRHKLSILCLAHTPKRDNTKPMSKNDLAGSKMLINFCDSCFCIGESAYDKTVRYVKQIKQRNCEEMYGADNVLLHYIEKPDNFLQFLFFGYSKEWEHLKQKTDDDKQKLLDRILALRDQGKTLRDIAAEVGMAHSHVSKLIKEHNEKMPFEYPKE